MHPSKDDLRALVDGRLDKIADIESVRKHVNSCEFCTEFCDAYRSYIQAETVSDSEFADAAAKIVGREYTGGNVIELSLLRKSETTGTTRMAADSEKPRGDRLIATFASEDPDMILRLKRSADEQSDYFQLVAADPKQVANVLIRIPELNWEIITDSMGRGTIEEPFKDDPAGLKWQIVLPNAEFDLEPVSYDPDRTEYSEKLELTTEKDDCIWVLFEGKTEGHQITLWIDRLNGKTDFTEARVVVSCGELVQQTTAMQNSAVTFELPELSEGLKVRVFEK